MSIAYIEIPLTQGKVALIDVDDHESVSQFKWRADCPGGKWYAYRTRHVEGGRTRQGLHSYLTGYTITDHRDGDGLNNRRSNLREATARQNGGNVISRGGSSKYRGVIWLKSLRKWVAREQWLDEKGRHCRYLGSFDVEDDAARAWDAVARERYGEYASLNFPKPGERSAVSGEIAQ